MRRAVCLLLATILLAGTGCGTVVVTSTDPTARLYAGGRMLGRGTGELRRRGTPESTTITAISEDGRRAQTIARREFTGVTFLAGLFTYGICLIACWEYPSVVLVDLPPAAAPHQSEYGSDPWLIPPPGWQPRADETPARTPEPAPAPTPAAPQSSQR